MIEQRTKSKEYPFTDTENNNDSTSEKCPEMTQSMLEDERILEILKADNDSFSKIADLLSFQDSESKTFSSVLIKKSTKNPPKGPKYRVISKYLKSKNQYWRERNRRKKVWELTGQGFNYKQIAEKLGVSEKTVQRDIKKIQPYYTRLSSKYFRDLEQQRIGNLNAELEGKTLFQRFNILTKKMVDYRFLMKQREYKRHMIKIIIDMDDQTYGFPAIHLWPKPPLSLGGRPYYFQFHVQRNGEQIYIGEIKLG